MKRLLAVLALGALVIACSEQTTSSQQGTLAALPSFNISNAPAQTGVVLRSQWPGGVIWGVESEGLLVFLGADARDACVSYLTYGDPFTDATWSIITYADKILFDRVLTNAQTTDVPTQVWAYSGGHLDALCPSIAGGAEPLATGVTRGNQFFGDKTLLFNYHGLLTRSDDSQAVFAFQLQFREGEPTKVTISLR